MEDKQLTPSSGDLIPSDGGGPPVEPWWQRVWERVTNWFDDVSWGGIYDTKVDRTHYDRWWWSWHLISDSSETQGGIAGWASNVYDYFQNWVGNAREQLSEKVGRVQQVIRGATEGGFWGGIKDTFDTWGATFASFRSNPATFIYDRLPQWIKDLKSLWDNAWTWLWNHFVQWFKDAVNLVNTWKTEITNFFTNLYTTVKDFLSRIWAWLWEHFQQWVKDILDYLQSTWLKVKDFFTNLYTTIADFLSRVWLWIYEHIPQEFKDIWNNAKTWWDWLSLRWDNFTRELDWFLDDPYLYLTSMLKVWIEGWRDYIFQEVKELVLSHQNLLTDGLVRLTINLFPLEPVDRLPSHEYADLDTFIESMMWWIEGDGGKQQYGYDEVFRWAKENVLGERELPHGL